jgi:hypothetical protein
VQLPFWGYDTSHVSRRAGRGYIQPLPTCGSDPPASSHRKFGDLTDTGNLTAREVFVQIPEILLKIGKRFALSQIIWKVLEIPEPHFTVLPMDVPGPTHKAILPPPSSGHKTWLVTNWCKPADTKFSRTTGLSAFEELAHLGWRLAQVPS